MSAIPPYAAGPAEERVPLPAFGACNADSTHSEDTEETEEPDCGLYDPSTTDDGLYDPSTQDDGLVVAEPNADDEQDSWSPDVVYDYDYDPQRYWDDELNLGGDAWSHGFHDVDTFSQQSWCGTATSEHFWAWGAHALTAPLPTSQGLFTDTAAQLRHSEQKSLGPRSAQLSLGDRLAPPAAAPGPARAAGRRTSEFGERGGAPRGALMASPAEPGRRGMDATAGAVHDAGEVHSIFCQKDPLSDYDFSVPPSWNWRPKAKRGAAAGATGGDGGAKAPLSSGGAPPPPSEVGPSSEWSPRWCAKLRDLIAEAAATAAAAPPQETQ